MKDRRPPTPVPLVSAQIAPRLAEEGWPDVDPGSGSHAVPERTPDFDTVYVSYFPHVLRWLRAFGCPSSELDDLAQETFIIVRRKLPEYEPRNLSGWVYRIAQHVASDHRRRAWFRRWWRGPSNSDAVLESAPDHGASPEELSSLRESAAVVERALASLSDAKRRAFHLFEIEGYSGEELAELEQVPLNTIYTRLHHARREFADHVAALTANGSRRGRL